MGATIYPAQHKEVNIGGEWRHVLESVVNYEDFQIDDPDYGTISIGNPWEMHLSYSTVGRLFELLTYGVERDQYSAEYGLYDVCGRIEALIESDDRWDQLSEREMDLMYGLLRICFYGLRHGATLIAWS